MLEGCTQTRCWQEIAALFYFDRQIGGGATRVGAEVQFHFSFTTFLLSFVFSRREWWNDQKLIEVCNSVFTFFHRLKTIFRGMTNMIRIYFLGAIASYKNPIVLGTTVKVENKATTIIFPRVYIIFWQSCGCLSAFLECNSCLLAKNGNWFMDSKRFAGRVDK